MRRFRQRLTAAFKAFRFTLVVHWWVLRRSLWRKVNSLPQRTSGLNFIGHLQGSLGLGETARLLARVLDESSLNCSFYSVPLAGRDTQEPGVQLSSDLPHGTSVIHINPPEVWLFLRRNTHLLCPKKRLMAIWFWETEEPPAQWIILSRLFDEVWVASSWSKQTFGKHLRCPTRVFPIPLDAFSRYNGSALKEVGGHCIADNAYLFLNVFDYYSSFERKNPIASIRAFKCAFPHSQENSILFVKTLNANARPELHLELLKETKGRSDIIVMNADLPKEVMSQLYSRADCFLSLHRSEGLGMGFLQSIANGKSAIVTNYSAPADFAGLPGLYMIDFELTLIRGDIAAYQGIKGRWAEPSIPDAAKCILSVACRGRVRVPHCQNFEPHTSAMFAQFVGAFLIDSEKAGHAASSR